MVTMLVTCVDYVVGSTKTLPSLNQVLGMSTVSEQKYYKH